MRSVLAPYQSARSGKRDVRKSGRLLDRGKKRAPDASNPPGKREKPQATATGRGFSPLGLRPPLRRLSSARTPGDQQRSKQARRRSFRRQLHLPKWKNLRLRRTCPKRRFAQRAKESGVACRRLAQARRRHRQRQKTQIVAVAAELPQPLADGRSACGGAVYSRSHRRANARAQQQQRRQHTADRCRPIMLVRHAKVRQKAHRLAAAATPVTMHPKLRVAAVRRDHASRIAPLVAKQPAAATAIRTLRRQRRAQRAPIVGVFLNVSFETNKLSARLCGWLVVLSLFLEGKNPTAQSLL